MAEHSKQLMPLEDGFTEASPILRGQFWEFPLHLLSFPQRLVFQLTRVLFLESEYFELPDLVVSILLWAPTPERGPDAGGEEKGKRRGTGKGK